MSVQEDPFIMLHVDSTQFEVRCADSITVVQHCSKFEQRFQSCVLTVTRVASGILWACRNQHQVSLYRGHWVLNKMQFYK